MMLLPAAAAATAAAVDAADAAAPTSRANAPKLATAWPAAAGSGRRRAVALSSAHRARRATAKPDSLVGSRTHTPRTPLRSCRDRGVWRLAVRELLLAARPKFTGIYVGNGLRFAEIRLSRLKKLTHTHTSDTHARLPTSESGCGRPARRRRRAAAACVRACVLRAASQPPPPSSDGIAMQRRFCEAGDGGWGGARYKVSGPILEPAVETVPSDSRRILNYPRSSTCPTVPNMASATSYSRR
jgi:hypothetical protein